MYSTKSTSKLNLLITSISLYIFIIALLTFSAQYKNFGESSGDLAVHNQCFWNAINGKGFINTFEGGHHFGIHFSPIFYLLLPFYYLYPSPYTLQWLNILLFSLSIFFFSGILKGMEPKYSLIFFILLFYLHPVIYNIAQSCFRPESLILFFFLGCFYFYKKKKFLLFFLFLILCNSLRETTIFMTAIFSLVALKEKRDKLWVLTPIILSISWAMFAFGLVIPHFSKASTIGFAHHVGGHFGYLKNTFNNGFNAKILFENIFLMRKLSFLLKLLIPLGIITPFFNNVWIFGIPDLIGVIFSKLPRVTSTSLSSGASIYMAFLLSAVIYLGKNRILERKKIQYVLKKLYPLAIALIFIFPLYNYLLILTNTKLIINYQDIIKTEKVSNPSSTFRTIINLIPINASVSAPARIANHLSSRDTLYLDVNFNTEYIVGNDKFLKNADQTSLTKYFDPIFTENSWTLYKKKE